MVRIGTVGYLNALPLTVALRRDRYEVRAGTPSQVARWLSLGEVDVGLAPVAAVFGTDNRVVPGVAIGADGPVTSVLLVGDTPPEHWERVVLDAASRTSALLTRVLVAEGVVPRVEISEATVPSLDCAGGATAALVIGDAARRVPEHLCHRLDLGEVWKRWTGLPFVFAVWAGRPDLPASVVEDLRAAAREGLLARSEVEDPTDREYLLEAVRYELGDRELMGLRRFAALACRHGWLSTDTVALYGPDRTLRRVRCDEALEAAVRREPLSLSAWGLLAREARLDELLLAARSLPAEPPVWLKQVPEGVATVVIGPEPGDWAGALAAAPQAPWLRLTSTGMGRTSDTAVDAARALALARMMRPQMRLLAPTTPASLLQTALAIGAAGVVIDDRDEVVRHAEDAGVLG